MTNSIFKAIEFAARSHAGHTRRDGKTPYLVHPVDVARRVWGYTKDETLTIAAVLHDTVEHLIEEVQPMNGEYGRDAIQKIFGDDVVNLVDELTDKFYKRDYPHLNRKDRKQLEWDRYQSMSVGARLIKCCDIQSNTEDCKDDPSFIFYIKEARRAVQYLTTTLPEGIRAWEDALNILGL